MKAQKKGLLTLSPTVLTSGKDREFGIKFHVNGKGGGPALAMIFYWGTKVVLYGAIAAGPASFVAVGINEAGGGKAAATGTAIAAVSGVSISGMIETAAMAAYAAGLAAPCP